MKKILVIGGMGYIGTVFIKNMLKRNYMITCIDNFIYNQLIQKNLFSDIKNFKFIEKDFRNFYFEVSYLNKFDNIVIFGGLVGDPITKKYNDLSVSINDIGLKKVIDAFDNSLVKKIIFISTCSNYGLVENGRLADEKCKLNPLSQYAKSKVELENYILSKKGKVNYEAIILRFATAFGLSPRMRFDLTINEFVREIFINKKLVVYDENTWRPYCHVVDFTNLIEKVINYKKDDINFEIFNAGSEKNNATKFQLTNKLKIYFPNAKFIFKSQGSDLRDYRVNFTKVKKFFDFNPQISIDDGIKEILKELKEGKYKDLNYYSDKLGNYSIDEKI